MPQLAGHGQVKVDDVVGLVGLELVKPVRVAQDPRLVRTHAVVQRSSAVYASRATRPSFVRRISTSAPKRPGVRQVRYTTGGW